MVSKILYCLYEKAIIWDQKHKKQKNNSFIQDIDVLQLPKISVLTRKSVQDVIIFPLKYDMEPLRQDKNISSFNVLKQVF